MSATVEFMSPVLVMTIVLTIAMGIGLVDLHAGGHYVCPDCGAKRPDEHADDCSWRPR